MVSLISGVARFYRAAFFVDYFIIFDIIIAYLTCMKRRLLTYVILFVFGVTLSTTACAKPGGHKDLRIILIRHGEKPDNGDNLTCAGLNRALKLPEVLKNKFGIPDYIYAPSPNTGKQTKNGRMLQTIMPFAVKYNLTINTSCNVDESDKLVKDINKTSGT